MNEKRYSIVRVEGCNEERLKLCPNMPTCSFCLYGDTKEQLVLKITQVLRTKRALFGITDKQLAESIVEFLGVEDERKI